MIESANDPRMGSIIQIYMGVLMGETRRPRKLLPKTLYKVRTVDLLMRAVYSRYYVLLADSLVRACTPVGLLSSSNSRDIHTN